MDSDNENNVYVDPDDFGDSADAAVLMYADDYCTKMYIDSFINHKTHKTNMQNLKLFHQRHLDILGCQVRMYQAALLPDCPFRFTKCEEYSTQQDTVGIKIVANHFIKKGTEIKQLCGQRYFIDEKYIVPGVNDFSLLCTTRVKIKEFMFLGPISYMNHSCEGNSSWHTSGKKSLVTTITRVNIQKGQEITTYYGPHYFGKNNVDCECIFCRQKHQVDSSKFDEVSSHTLPNTDVNMKESSAVNTDVNMKASTAMPTTSAIIEQQDTSGQSASESDDDVSSHTLPNTDVNMKESTAMPTTSAINEQQDTSEQSASESDDDDSSHTLSKSAVKIYECNVCGKAFIYKCLLKRHILTHVDGTIICPICYKTYKREDNLKDHMNVHSNLHSFSCSVCGKQFNDRRNMNAHIKSIHNVETITCPLCKKIYSSKTELHRHINRMHIKIDRYFCGCGLGFKVPNMLTKHRKKTNHIN